MFANKSTMTLSFSLLAYSGTSFSISTGIRLAPMATLCASRVTTVSYSTPRRALHMSASVKGSATKQTLPVRSHLVSFFSQYHDFKYNPNEPFMDEFRRLVATNSFGYRGKRHRLARRGLREAILLEFKDIYGTHTSSHTSVVHVWHEFFKVIGVDEAPPNRGLCRKRAKSIHVNICDLIDRPVTGIPIKNFPTEEELSRYTIGDGGKPKIAPGIPKEWDPIIGHLYRRIINPPKTKVKDAPLISSSPAKAAKGPEDAIHGVSP